MGILDTIPGIVAATAGSLLFKGATLTRISARVSDGRGGHTQTPQNEAVKALVVDYTAFQRAAAGIPSNERKIIIQGQGLSEAPAPQDTLTIDGRTWSVIEVSRDPAGATYEARAK